MDKSKPLKKETIKLPSTAGAQKQDILSKSIEQGKLLASKIESLKETISKNDPKASVTSQTFLNAASTGKDHFLKRNIEQAVTFPLDIKPTPRETVIETADGELVKKKIEAFISGLKPESQQNAIDDSQLYNDPEFASESAIHLSSDTLQDDFSKSLDFSRITWKRIKDIASNPLICGFDTYSGECLEKANPDKSLIVQGLIGDNWFLSALSAVFQHDYLWNQITGGDKFIKYRDYGLYVFRFVKDNKHYHVIIDDKLPVIERSTGQLIPVFARCLNPNLFWVSLIEKAYAKLHYRYYSLHNGYIEDALYDLTGLNPESIILDSEYILKDNLKNCLDVLKVLTLSGACICTNISTERVQYTDAKRLKLKNDAESSGLSLNHWYNLHDIRDLSEFDGKPEPTYKLLRIHSPWGLSKIQWSGDFSKTDKRWENKRFGERFNAFYLEQLNRYGENIFGNDFETKMQNGNAILTLEDYLKFYNSMVIVRDYPQQFNGIEYEGNWVPSHGHPHIKSTNWMNNPHYIIKIARKSGEQTPITVVLQQKDTRFVPPGQDAKQLGIGLMILSMVPVEEDVKFYDAKRTIGFIKPTDSRFVQWRSFLGNGKYCIIPVTRNAGDIGPYFLKIYYGCTNDELILSKTGFKVIMEQEKFDEAQKNTMRVMDINLSARIVKEFMEKSKLGKWAERVLTPFSIDDLLNPSLSQATSKTIAGQSAAKAARSKAKTSGAFTREYENDLKLKLYDPKLDKEKEYFYACQIMNREDKIAVLLGLDEESRKSKTNMTEIEIEQAQKAYADALTSVSDILDLNFYFIGDKYFIYLEMNRGIQLLYEFIEVKPVTKLYLRGNKIGNEGIIKLCKMIEDSHKSKLELLDVGENEFGTQGAASLYALMERMTELKTLLFDGNEKLTEAAKARLEFICKSKNPNK